MRRRAAPRIQHSAGRNRCGTAGRLRRLQKRDLSGPWRRSRHRPRAIRTGSRGSVVGHPGAGAGSRLGALPRAQGWERSWGSPHRSAGARVDGGFEASQNNEGFIAGLDLAFRIGLGLRGRWETRGTGSHFSGGLTADGPSSNKISDTGLGTLGGSLSAAIPARSGLSTRIRLPYYLVPGDLLFLSPMYFFNPEKYTQLAVTASNGGLLRFEQGWATRFGRFQFVLGRELGVTFYGLWGDPQLVAPPVPPPPSGAWSISSRLTSSCHPRVPPLPSVLCKPELDRLVPAVRRRRRALRRIGGLSDWCPDTQSAHGLVGRRAHDLRLEVLLAMTALIRNPRSATNPNSSRALGYSDTGRSEGVFRPHCSPGRIGRGLCDTAVESLLCRYAAACSRPCGTGGCSGQAGPVSRNLLRGP